MYIFELVLIYFCLFLGVYEIYVKDSFSAFMAKELTNKAWHRLLKDLDKYLYYCNKGYLGAPTVDFVRAVALTREETNQTIADLASDKAQYAHFHFKVCNS